MTVLMVACGSGGSGSPPDDLSPVANSYNRVIDRYEAALNKAVVKAKAISDQDQRNQQLATDEIAAEKRFDSDLQALDWPGDTPGKVSVDARALDAQSQQVTKDEQAVLLDVIDESLGKTSTFDADSKVWGTDFDREKQLQNSLWSDLGSAGQKPWS